MSRLLFTAGCLLGATASAGEPGPYRSPWAVAVSPRDGLVAVSDHTAARLAFLDADRSQWRGEVALQGQPSSVAWRADGAAVYVAERGAGTVAEVDPATRKVTRRFKVGRYPVGLAVAGERLVVANSGLNSVSIINLATGTELARVPVIAQPWAVALTTNATTAVVGNLLPAGDARNPAMAAGISLVDVAAGRVTTNIALCPGAINVRGIAVSPDGQWAYALHSVGRFTLPTTQLERGWIMTHGMSLIDLSTRRRVATVLFDSLSEGAANPWEISLAPDGATAWVSLAGVGQLVRIDLAKLHRLLRDKGDPEVLKTLPPGSLWHAIAKDPARAADLVDDLGAMATAKLLQRHDLQATMPRGLALSRNGQQLIIADYFAGQVLLADAQTGTVARRIPLGPQPAEDHVRAGERIFEDARSCFQNWLSCSSCHPGTRADGLNWDLLNDGLGNAKNTKSLVLSYRTPPMMATGVRPNMEAATEKGFMFIQFRVMADEQMDRVRDWLRAVRPEPSPFLTDQPGARLACQTCHVPGKTGSLPPNHRPIDGTLTPAAARGLKLFHDRQVGCATCHPGPLFTDLKMYDVGTGRAADRRADFDTPTLHELWRTAPYLHDGSAASLMEVLVEMNQQDKHGRTGHLSREQLEDLVAFLQSL